VKWVGAPLSVRPSLLSEPHLRRQAAVVPAQTSEAVDQAMIRRDQERLQASAADLLQRPILVEEICRVPAESTIRRNQKTKSVSKPGLGKRVGWVPACQWRGTAQGIHMTQCLPALSAS
jgi:hypothetical protein